MGSATSIFIGMLALVAFWLGVHFFNNYVVAALFLLAAILIGKSLQPVVLMLWYKFQDKFFPLPPVNTLEEKRFPENGMVGDIPAYMLGMRVLAMTEDLDAVTCRHAYDEMIEESLDKLDHEFDLFRVRHEAVERRESPVEYVWSLCGPEGEQMNKCFKAWMKSPNVIEMKARQQNRDMFLHDGTVTLKNGRAVRYTVMVLFDGTLPLTIPQKEETPAENGAETTAPAITDGAGKDAAAGEAQTDAPVSAEDRPG